MRKIVSWLSWQKIVFLIVLGLVIYQSKLGFGQWLLGWDSLAPELNWKLNFARALAGTWQEYQGLGLTGGMAHLADLPRVIIMWIFNLVLPVNYVRWVWHIGMLVLGPLGIWYMGKRLWSWSESACLAASSFYLLNLATVQYFFVPYEAFSSFYGFLPWLISTYLSYLESGKRRDLLLMAVVGILATPAFYVQTLFLVYVIVMAILSIASYRKLGRVLKGALVILTLNSFWLLPAIYGLVNGGVLVGSAKINSIASPETALMNQTFGDWRDVIGLRGFWLEYIEWMHGSEWGRLLQSWWEWIGQTKIVILGWILFGLSELGLLVQVIRRKINWTWILVGIFCLMMIGTVNHPLGIGYQYIATKIPLFDEIFRSVFTKWSVVLALFLSVGIGMMVAIFKNKLVASLSVILIMTSCVGVVWPVFRQGIIFDKMKVELPTEYLEMFEFMKTQTQDARLVYLPAQDMWSWKYNNWGYRGSGFLWYALEQPILDRAFDVWSPYNESFYNEFSTALYGGSQAQVKQILDKYDVRYVLLDESVISPGQDAKILRIPETKMIMMEIGAREVWKQGFLTVWDLGQKSDQFVSAPGSYTWVEGETSKVRRDVVWRDTGHYASAVTELNSDTVPQVIYPFAGLMREEIKGVEYGDDSVQLTANGVQQGQELIIPGWEAGDIVRIEFKGGEALPAYYVNGQAGPRFLGKEKPEKGKNYIVARVSNGDEWGQYLREQRFDLQGATLQVEVGGEPEIYDFGTEGKAEVKNCDVLARGIAQKLGSTYMADLYGAVCDYIALTEIDTRTSYLMRMRGENREGLSLKFYLFNGGSGRNDLEYLLDKGKFDQTFSLLPWEFSGQYSLNIVTRSFGQRVENIADPVEIRWFPLVQIAGAKVINNQSSNSNNQTIDNNLKILNIHKTGTWLYRVKVEGSGLLKLSQGYDEGWISLDLEHVKVDGWANGWIVPSSGVATIFYWPQLLEYLGFVILAGTVFLVLKHK